jgi:anti-sigma B factor antagonist
MAPRPVPTGLKVTDAGIGPSRHYVLVGELDLATVPILRECIAGALAAGEGDLVLDVAGLVFVDSTGLGALLAAARTVRTQGDCLVLKSPRGQLRHIIDITKLTPLFRLED